MTVCDGCGRERRIYRTQEVVVCGEVDDHFGFCFLCVKEDERAEAKREREEYRRIQREAAQSMAAQGYPTTCQGVEYLTAKPAGVDSAQNPGHRRP